MRSNHPQRDEIDRVAQLLISVWAKAEPDHGVTKYPASYVATFVDMARAVVEDRCDVATDNARLRAVLIDTRGFLRGFARRPELSSGSQDLIDEADVIDRVLNVDKP